MSFFDNPIVDKNAERSEDSVLKIRSFFKLTTGFLCREESPDYGVDFDIELLDGKQNTTGHKFAIQVKSAKKVKVITKDNKNYISLQFKTSRLGYLIRRTPGLGLITLYDDNSQKTYYDYVELIEERIITQQKNNKWKMQETVNINLPANNLLTRETVKGIYAKFSRRFLNHKILLSQHAQKFDLPINISPKEINEKDPISLLISYGHLLINNNYFTILTDLFEKADKSKIKSSHTLCLYGALGYSEIGNAIEAKYYLMRVNQFKEKYDSNELELISLVAPRIDFILGNLSFESYNEVMKECSKAISTPINKVNIQINLFVEETANQIFKHQYNHSFEEKLIAFFNEIEKLEIDDKHKWNFICQHSDTVLGYAASFFSKIMIRGKIANKISAPQNSEEIRNKLQRFKTLVSVCDSRFEKGILFSNKEKDNIISGLIRLVQGNFFIGCQFNLFIVQEVQKYSEQVEKEYQFHANSMYKAFSSFSLEQLHGQAHKSLNVYLDIKRLFKASYSKELAGENEHTVNQILKSIETETGIQSFNSTIKKAISEIPSLKTELSNHRKWANMTDEKLLYAANIFLDLYKLPKERLKNIILDIENYRKFYQIFTQEHIELIQNLSHFNSSEMKYKHPPTYMAINKKKDLRTVPHSDIEILIELTKKII